MAKDPSPLLGYNNNIRHKNRVFHIQTEDSGVRHPHVITHLFMDGGRILKSVKTSYAEHLGADKMADMVRKMMKDQHKGMLIALRDGQFDTVIEGGDAPKPAPSSPDPVSKPAASAPAVPAPPSSAPELPPARPQMRSAPVLPVTMDKVPQVDISEAEGSAPLLKSGEGMPLDLTPPPANMFRPRGTGSYSELGDPSGGEETKPTPAPSGRNPSRPPGKGASSSPPGAVVSKSSGLRSPSPAPRGGPPIRRGSTPPAPRTDSEPRAARRAGSSPVIIERPAESRYASARPAAIFGQTKPRGGSSIFGEDIISDKSLDEVIMSYLADDLAPGGGGGGEGGNSSSGTRPVPPKPRK